MQHHDDDQAPTTDPSPSVDPAAETEQRPPLIPIDGARHRRRTKLLEERGVSEEDMEAAAEATARAYAPYFQAFREIIPMLRPPARNPEIEAWERAVCASLRGGASAGSAIAYARQVIEARRQLVDELAEGPTPL